MAVAESVARGAEASPERPEHVPASGGSRWPWLKYATPIAVLLLAAALIITLTRNWNSWEGGRAEQVTDDAIVRGDLTPLSTKVSGIVREVKVSDYQKVRKGDLLVELHDEDYQALVGTSDSRSRGSESCHRKQPKAEGSPGIENRARAGRN